MASYDSAVAALTSIAAGQTLAEAGHADRHNQGNAASEALAAYLDALEAKRPAANVRLSIVEYAPGTWSGDAPPGRTGAQNPILFTPYDPTAVIDPADGVNGIATPSNLRDWDLIGPVPGAVTVAPPEPEPTVIAHGTDLRREDVGLTSSESELTTVSGPLEPAENEVLENVRVTYYGEFMADAAIHVVHNNVTIRNVKVESDGVAGGIFVHPGVTGTVIEHCHIDGMSPYYGTGRSDANFGNSGMRVHSRSTVRRCFMTGVKSGVAMRDPGSTVVENWVDYLHQNAPRVSTSGFNYRGSGQSAPPNTTVARNRLVAGTSAGLNMYPTSGVLRNVWYVDNYVIGVGDGFGVRGGRSFTDNGNYCYASNIKIEGNRFAGEFEYPTALGEGTNAAVDLSRPGNTFDNNRWLPGYGTITGDLPARCGASQDDCEGPECP